MRTLADVEKTPVAEYVQRLRPFLPDEAFAPCPRKLLRQIFHFVVLFSAYVGIRLTDHWSILSLCSLVIGHSLACTGFFAHELSHNTVFRNSRLRYLFEIICWGLNFVPPTVWNRVHNHTHHIHPNSLNDPDRRFLTSEACRITRWYSQIFYPNNRSSKWNFIVGFHFWPYILRNTVASFYPNKSKPILVPAKPIYTRQERLIVAQEIVAIVIFECVIFYFVGANFKRFAFASLLPMLITSSIVMSYIFTNHFLNPVSMNSDPLVNTTSVVVHPIFDWLHLNFSYHTEHHLFPGMNSDYYPKVSCLLMQDYENRYNRITFADAWNRLWKMKIYEANDTKSYTAPLGQA